MTDNGNEEDEGGRRAYLFACGDLAAVSLEEDGANLPMKRQWTFLRPFTLGVRDVGPWGKNPEPIIRGLLSDGFYVWREGGDSRSATSQ